MKVLLAVGLLPALAGGGLVLGVPEPHPSQRTAYLVGSQRLPCLYARLAVQQGKNVARGQLEDCAQRWKDREAAALLAAAPADELPPR